MTVTRVGFERAAADGGGWVEREVDNETVGLTELKGANATLIDEYDVPNGTYSKVFVHSLRMSTIRTWDPSLFDLVIYSPDVFTSTLRRVFPPIGAGT